MDNILHALNVVAALAATLKIFLWLIVLAGAGYLAWRIARRRQ